ncbi:MAG: glycosyltransferase family 52, partial [Bacteroidota bacterium]
NVKSSLTKTPIGGGFDKQVATIYAQFPNRLPQGIRNKAVELNIKKEVAKLDAQTKTELFEIFIPESNFKIDGDKNALVLTQPISEDQVVKDEATKIDIYRSVIQGIPEDMNIILKTHPRETTNYKSHFKQITVLPALFPIEILGLKEGFYFESGYTLFSTALSNLEIVKKRHFLGKEYLDKFTVKATRDLIKNMVEEP